ncbi:GntP family permease [Dendrosporobacter sp. 1207_IL3150]|uniref:GntP family permease n=1 Tax=Dendrosporobacter sp. 1207_IL3150 TaxID=3084054 RepID=UPI002FD95B52
MDFAAILVSLALLMIFAYKGYSIILFAPLFAMTASIGSGYEIMPVFSEIYMTKIAEYVKIYFPVFLLGAVFAKIMEEGGMASSVAAAIVRSLGKERAVLSVLLGCGVLTYGGLSVFVVAFVMYPFAAILFREADIPKRLIPATLWMGIFTYAMVALPGTPQIQNIIPTTFFGTSTWAGPMLGLIGGVLYFCFGWAWITYRHRRLALKGEGYGTHSLNEPKPVKDELPHWSVSAIPLAAVILVNIYMSNPFHWNWAYHWDSKSLAALRPLNLTLLSSSVDRIQAIWSLNIALGIGIVCAALIGRKRIAKNGGLIFPVNIGAVSSVSAILNTASGYAFGAVIASLAGFQTVKNALFELRIGNSPLLSEVVTTNIMVAFAGSSSGGITIALGMLGKEWLNWANAVGIQPEVVHRIACLASGGLDTVPHGGALVTLIAVCGLTHKESYYDVFILTLMKVTVGFLGVLIYTTTGLI